MYDGSIDFRAYQVASEINDELRAIKAEPSQGFKVGAILSIAKRSNLTTIYI